MMPSVISEAQGIRWWCHKNSYYIPLITGRHCINHHGEIVPSPIPSPARGLLPKHVSGAWTERKTERSGRKTDLSGAERWAGFKKSNGAWAEQEREAVRSGNGVMSGTPVNEASDEREILPLRSHAVVVTSFVWKISLNERCLDSWVRQSVARVDSRKLVSTFETRERERERQRQRERDFICAKQATKRDMPIKPGANLIIFL